MDIERNLQQASSDIKDVMTRGRGGNYGDSPVQRVDVPKATWVDFARYFGKWQNGKVLLGAAYSWFALDVRWRCRLFFVHWLVHVQVAFYGLGLNSSMILHDIISFGGGTPKDTQGFYHKLYDTCLANLILSVAGWIPGYWATFLCVDSWGRKPIQLMGFSVLTIIFIIMGAFTAAKNSEYKLWSRFWIRQTHHDCSFPGRLCVPLLSGQLLPEFWSQLNHLHCSWRSLPYSISLNRPWYLCCFR